MVSRPGSKAEYQSARRRPRRIDSCFRDAPCVKLVRHLPEQATCRSSRSASAVRRGAADVRLLFWMAGLRNRDFRSARCSRADIALREPNWPARATQVCECFAQPVRTAGAVLRADHSLDHHAPRRYHFRRPGMDFRTLRAWVHAGIHITQQRRHRARRCLWRGRARAPDHVGDLHRAHLARARDDARRPPLRRDRGARRHRRPPSSGARCAQGLGPFASLRRLRRPGGDRGARLRRAAAQGLGGLRHGRDDAARASCSACCGSSASSTLRRSRGSPMARASRPPRSTDDERARLEAASLDGAPPWVAGDYPEWLDPHLAREFGDERAAEGSALASRAPLDLRVNALKAERDELGRIARRSRRAADALVAARAAHRARCRRQEPGDPCRACLHQGHDRDPGRRLAARRTSAPAQTRRAGDRSMRRRRRQDAGARRRDGEPRPDLRHRYRQAPARAHPCPARARGRA